MKKIKEQYYSLILLASMIVAIPGCGFGDWFGHSSCPSCQQPQKNDKKVTQKADKKSANKADTKDASVAGDTIDTTDSSAALVSRKDKSLLSANTFDKYWQLLLSNPETRMQLEINPSAKKDILDNFAKQVVVKEWLYDSGLADDSFKERLELQKQLVESNLAYQKFQEYVLEKHLNFTDKEIKEYYEKNKTEQSIFQQSPFLEQTAGVKAQSVEFDNEKDAQAFYDAVSKNGKGFSKKASDKNLTVKDLGVINDRSYGVDGSVRRELLEVKDFPKVLLVKDAENKRFWVVNALSKQDAQYIEFNDQVKDMVKRVMDRERYPEAEEKVINDIKEDLGINIDSAFFDGEIKEKQAQMDDMIKKFQEKASQEKDGEQDQDGQADQADKAQDIQAG
jgi:hypothetical protein